MHDLNLTPPVTVTTRNITSLVGNPYKVSFATVTGWGVDLMHDLKNSRFGFIAFTKTLLSAKDR